MTQDTSTGIIAASLIWIIILLIYMSNQKQKSLTDLSAKEIKFEKERNQILDQMRVEKQTEFEKGYISGAEKSDFIIHVEPYKNLNGKKGYFQNSQVVEIGYVYRLFVKGVPSLDPHIQIVERIKLSELNEQNVDSALGKLEMILDKIPSPHLKLAGNLKDFGKGLLKNMKTKRLE
ncbi:hypothetical protein ES711_12720 [Gelidibacter salicanalis]|uniref:Uncharacterized protein n=1 Tax=Gelidibacter salicanalis TaxID=291193 RepID=A0A5C7ADB0_9FLAO|nr:hypothetical protein [Gelidibacter salicanalis]TXE06810.1 hypothetical protein ES711_12720 [Gelidibacter salicanalis]